MNKLKNWWGSPCLSVFKFFFWMVAKHASLTYTIWILIVVHSLLSRCKCIHDIHHQNMHCLAILSHALLAMLLQIAIVEVTKSFMPQLAYFNTMCLKYNRRRFWHKIRKDIQPKLVIYFPNHNLCSIRHIYNDYWMRCKHHSRSNTWMSDLIYRKMVDRQVRYMLYILKMHMI